MNQLMKALRARHEIVAIKIQDEQKAKRPDSIRLSILKRIRLRLRDQIAVLERMGNELNSGQRRKSPIRPVSIKV